MQISPIPYPSQTSPLDVPVAPALAGLEPLSAIKSRWPAIIGAVLTAAMLVGLGRELLGSGLAGLKQAVPTNPLFYLAFVGLYLTPPLFDYVIFRQLWNIPPSGLVALARKRIANDVVMGYSGEAYFYAWARQRSHIVAAPFGAVKDVTILSAISGNAVTLGMVLVALPFGHALFPPELRGYVAGSIAIIFATSIPFLIFSKRVFSLSRAELTTVFALHCARLLIGALFLALAWHFALPGVAMGIWLSLSAGRLLFSRLPLLPNKDLLFANLAILLLGQDHAIAELIAFVAAAVLLVHVALVAGFGVGDLVRQRGARG